MDKYDELCERLMGMPSVMAMRDAAAAIRELKASNAAALEEIERLKAPASEGEIAETLKELREVGFYCEATVQDVIEIIESLAAKVAELEDDKRCLTVVNEAMTNQANNAITRAERAEAAFAESERKCERLKLHAEAMDAATISHVDGRDLLAELHLNRAHYCDIRVRINGEYRTHEGDWLKNLQRERNAYRADFPKE